MITELTGPILADDGVEHGAAWVAGERITFERPRSVDARIDGWVIPGMVDMHCHLGVGPGGPVDIELAVKHARLEREAGVLLIRDTGSATDLDGLAAHDGLPTVIRSGRFIARHKRYLPGYAVEVEPEELAAEAARQARQGHWVKLIADWIDRSAGPNADLAPLWPDDALAAGIGAAHDAGARVTAHAFATEPIDALLDGGVDCIEHGTGMSGEQLERAAGLGVPVVPTLLQVDNFPSFAAQGQAKYPRYAAHMLAMHARRYEQVGAMVDAGVTVLLGTDAGTSVAHGSLAREALELGRCMPAAKVVAAATWRARSFLGVPALVEGAPADLVVLAEDPRKELGTLLSPVATILRGRMGS